MNDFPQPKFEVSETDVGERTRILDAAGEIHVSTAPRFSERLNAAIADGKTALVLGQAAGREVLADLADRALAVLIRDAQLGRLRHSRKVVAEERAVSR